MASLSILDVCNHFAYRHFFIVLLPLSSFALTDGTYTSRLKGTVTEIRDHILGEITGSQERLRRNITLYLMHRDDFDSLNYSIIQRPQTPAYNILSALSDPALRSKFDLLGLSNWKTPRISTTQVEATDTPDLVRPVANSPYFSLMEMSKSMTIHTVCLRSYCFDEH
ncbi:MAG TPA: hypothetical protein V6C97_22745 [Oculatellaceae cyanobacterium]